MRIYTNCNEMENSEKMSYNELINKKMVHIENDMYYVEDEEIIDSLEKITVKNGKMLFTFKGYMGKWYIIDKGYLKGEEYTLLEHYTYGDETGCLIVKFWFNIEENKRYGQIIMDDVFNGLQDLYDMYDITI